LIFSIGLWPIADEDADADADPHCPAAACQERGAIGRICRLLARLLGLGLGACAAIDKVLAVKVIFPRDF